MRIPKNIEKLLKRRIKLAEDLCCACSELDDWLEKNGANLMDSDIADSVMTGCLIYAEPSVAEKCVYDYIKEKM